MKMLVWILATIVAFLLLTLALNLPRQRRLRRLRRKRSGTDDFEAFHASLPDIPAEVARSVYTRVQGLVAPGFPLRSTDALSSTLEIDQGHLEDLIEALMSEPSVTSSTPAPDPAPPIMTVADLARAVARRRGAGRPC